jgi:hypothetical protein
MRRQIPLLLLSSAILLLPHSGRAESPGLPEFLIPSTCDLTSSEPEFPLFSQAEPESLPKAVPVESSRCGNCGVCAGALFDSICGFASGGEFMYCNPNIQKCTDGQRQCSCSRGHV